MNRNILANQGFFREFSWRAFAVQRSFMQPASLALDAHIKRRFLSYFFIRIFRSIFMTNFWIFLRETASVQIYVVGIIRNVISGIFVFSIFEGVLTVRRQSAQCCSVNCFLIILFFGGRSRVHFSVPARFFSSGVHCIIFNIGSIISLQ